jgi:SAM-dependent methyltransferase
MDKSIKKIHINKAGKVSDKWESYLDFYDRTLESLRDSDISLLEIGVQNGGSLETWAEYFPKGRIFIGCDIDPNCSKLKYEDSRVNVIVGDANKQETWNLICTTCSSFDLIIDDGSHHSTDILNSFLSYFPLLKPGGIYIIEDAHSLYLKSFHGGILNEFSAMQFFKKIVDVVNLQWWGNELSLDSYFRTFFQATDVPSFIADGSIDSITFQNSIICIRKAIVNSNEKLGERIISGQDASVQNWTSLSPKT